MIRSLEFFGWICVQRARLAIWCRSAEWYAQQHIKTFSKRCTAHTHTQAKQSTAQHNSPTEITIAAHQNDIDACLSRVSMKRPNEMWRRRRRRHQQPTALHIYYQMALSFNSHLPSVFFFRNSFRCCCYCCCFSFILFWFCDFVLFSSSFISVSFQPVDSFRPMFTVLCSPNEEDSAIYRVSFGALRCTVLLLLLPHHNEYLIQVQSWRSSVCSARLWSVLCALQRLACCISNSSVCLDRWYGF